MKRHSYYNNDICVVGVGCVLPGARNPREFWKNILAENCSIKEMPEERFKKSLYFSNDKNEKDKAYSNQAAFIENSWLEKICEDAGLDFSKNNRLQVMSVEAARQALSCLRAGSLKKRTENTSVFLGCMETDAGFALEKFFSYNETSLKKYIEKSGLKDQQRIFGAIKKHCGGGGSTAENEKIATVLAMSAVSAIKKQFSVRGEGVLVDAACASSLAALDTAANALRNYQTDFAITGGAESNLKPDSFVLFSKVGALSSGTCLPFDKRTDGLSQGEGAVIFALQRMEDAVKDKNKIYGVIQSIGGSSDGRGSSLFSPSLGGQLLAYERAYQGLDKESVDYIECHGTGTKLGDSMEVKSLNKFFPSGKIPIGSVKSLIGHTKGAAGAAGLLKCLLMMEKKTIPSSRYIRSSMAPQEGTVYTNKKPMQIRRKNKPLRFGVSSFGFGNINYHVVLDEFKENGAVMPPAVKKPAGEREIAVIGEGSARYDEIDPSLFVEKFKIPPKSLPHTDKIQLLALSAVHDAFEKSNIKIDSLDKEKVSVLSASIIGLDAALDFAYRIMTFEFQEALNFLDEESLNAMVTYKNRFPEVTEDTGPGILNNVIAGRICNTFDFKGKNFNIDADLNSFPAALKIALAEFARYDGIIALVFCEEKLDKKRMRIARKQAVSCILLSTLDVAKQENYPIRRLIKSVHYHE
ncbi:MAG: beta-ketoacyl synthase N-terminal-like domain-containing protein [Candidatus Moraniibacteriota bacterium]